MSDQATRIGLTGGIGSGKSTVAKMLSKLGVSIIDADMISKSVTAPNGAAINAIKLEFDDVMINADGSLDRTRMRDLVFQDATAKKRLESIIHPLIKLEIEHQEHAAVASGAQLIVYDIPLLVESTKWRPRLDHVMVVDCRKETQIQRVILRNQLTQAEVEKIIASQVSRTIRNLAADTVIFNDSITLEQLNDHVVQIAHYFEHSFDERKT